MLLFDILNGENVFEFLSNTCTLSLQTNNSPCLVRLIPYTTLLAIELGLLFLFLQTLKSFSRVSTVTSPFVEDIHTLPLLSWKSNAGLSIKIKLFSSTG